MKHNKLYSELVADFITNSERILKNLHSLPRQESAVQIAQKLAGVEERFKLLQNQFVQYDSQLSEYKDFVSGLVESRAEVRDDGDIRDEAYAGQLMIVERLEKMVFTLQGREATFKANRLQEEIVSYEQQMREFDKYYLRGDQQMLSELGTTKRHDEKLTAQEMEMLFQQNVRKIMNKHLRGNEQLVKQHGKDGLTGGLAGSAFVDYLAVLGVLGVGAFGYLANKKLQEQN